MSKSEVNEIIRGRELEPVPCRDCGVRPRMYAEDMEDATWVETAVVIVCVNPDCRLYGERTLGDPGFINSVIELWNDEQGVFDDEV